LANPLDNAVDIIDFTKGSFNPKFNIERYQTNVQELDAIEIYNLFMQENQRCFDEGQFVISK
jgi:hypothetical protein